MVAPISSGYADHEAPQKDSGARHLSRRAQSTVHNDQLTSSANVPRQCTTSTWHMGFFIGNQPAESARNLCGLVVLYT